MSVARTLSLRKISTLVVVLIGFLTILVSASLLFMTTSLHRQADSTAKSVESVRLLEEAEVSLLLDGQTQDLRAKQKYENELRSLMGDASQHVDSGDEAQHLHDANAKIDQYLASSQDPRSPPSVVEKNEDQATGALESMVDINVQQSHDAQRIARHWNELANIVGVGGGALLLLAACGSAVWLRVRVLRPLFSLEKNMERFGRGDREVRAAERGPAEIQAMSGRFNEMASAIAEQRDAQMAFLGSVAHDLRNPLGALRLAVEIPLASVQPPEPQLRRTLGIIGRQIERLDRMVGDFLDIARIEAGNLTLHLEDRDVRDLVRDAVELFEGTGAERIQVSQPDQRVPVRCDPMRIEQVIMNLVSNALKYSPANGRVEITSSLHERTAVIEVTDHGIGISPADQQRLFEPFRRVGSLKETVPGVGLGLFTVKRIVEAHGGKLELRSMASQGSTFRVRLPSAA